MKKVIRIIMTVLLIVNTTGCGNNTSNLNNNELESEKEYTRLLTEEEVVGMSNYMNKQRTISNGVWIYGISFNENGEGVLSKIKDDGSELTVLSRSSPSYINVISGWVYYLSYSWANKTITINKLRVSGEEEQILIEPSNENYEIQCMFIYKDNIYYAENYEPNNGRIEGKFYKADMDGKNVEVVLDKAVYYPYIVNDKLYYQDDNDDCRMHVCNIDGTEDKVLIDKNVFSFVIDGQFIYYETTDKPLEFDDNHNIVNGDKVKEVIAKCKIDGTDEIIIISNAHVGVMTMNNSTIYYTDGNDEYRLYSYDFASESVDLISQDSCVSNVSLLPNSIFYYDYSEDFEYVDYLYIASLDGTNKSTLFMD